MLALSACGHPQARSAAPRRSPATATSTTFAPSTTSTTVRAAKLPYSFDDNAPPPPLLNTGTNYVAIAKSLLDYDNWLLSHRPDIALIDNVAVRGTNPYKALAHDLPILRRTNRRFVEQVAAPDRFDVASVRPEVISIVDTQHLVRQVIYDAAGRNVSVHPRATTTYFVLLLRSASDHRWLLASIDEQGAAPKAHP